MYECFNKETGIVVAVCDTQRQARNVAIRMDGGKGEDVSTCTSELYLVRKQREQDIVNTYGA